MHNVLFMPDVIAARFTTVSCLRCKIRSTKIRSNIKCFGIQSNMHTKLDWEKTKEEFLISYVTENEKLSRSDESKAVGAFFFFFFAWDSFFFFRRFIAFASQKLRDGTKFEFFRLPFPLRFQLYARVWNYITYYYFYFKDCVAMWCLRVCLILLITNIIWRKITRYFWDFLSGSIICILW